MKIGFIAKRQEYTHSTPIMEDVYKGLRQRGATVEKIVPEEQLIDLASVSVDCDLYVLRPGAELGLSLASILHDKGARILNRFPACAYIQDKVRTTGRLLEANVPTAPSFITDSPQTVLHRLGTAVIVKPHRGSYGIGVEVLRPGEDKAFSDRGGYFVQRFLDSDREDLKVYVIGDEVFAIKRPFPAKSFSEKLGRVCSVNSHVRTLALTIGRLFDLEIYGVDFVETADGPFVIDINYFPGFIGVAGAAGHLVEYIVESAKSMPLNAVRHARTSHIA